MLCKQYHTGADSKQYILKETDCGKYGYHDNAEASWYQNNNLEGGHPVTRVFR